MRRPPKIVREICELSVMLKQQTHLASMLFIIKTPEVYLLLFICMAQRPSERQASPVRCCVQAHKIK